MESNLPNAYFRSFLCKWISVLYKTESTDNQTQQDEFKLNF